MVFAPYTDKIMIHGTPSVNSSPGVVTRVCRFCLKVSSVLSEMVFSYIFPVSKKSENEGCTLKGAPVLLEFLFGYKRKGFCSHFPRFEKKRKRAEHPVECASFA